MRVARGKLIRDIVHFGSADRMSAFSPQEGRLLLFSERIKSPKDLTSKRDHLLGS